MTTRLTLLSLVLFLTAIAEDFASRGPSYRLHPGDSVDVQFTYTPEYDDTVTIGPDGFVMLKSSGAVRIADLTVAEASDLVKRASATRLRDPEVAVTLRGFIKPHIVVAGEVAHPGNVEIRGKLSLVDAIALSGGFKESSKQTQVVVVHRTSPDLASVRVIDVKALMRPDKIREDIPLTPDDLVIVPKNRLGKIEPYVRIASLGMNGLYSVALLK